MHDVIKPYVDEGLVFSQTHPTLPLTIYSYSKLAPIQLGKPNEWPDIVKQCRGLILDDEGKIVARPFEKFFNVQEYGDSPPPHFGRVPHEVYEKHDGSLGIGFVYEGQRVLATRGSFESEQAIKGQEMFDILDFVPEQFTLLFEIIYPENRIVLDYGEEEKLILLGAIEPHSGHNLIHKQLEQIADRLGVELAELHVPMMPQFLVKRQRTKREGYVLVWHYADGTYRAKVKHDEYVRLHRLYTGFTRRRIWECLMRGDDIEEMIDYAEEEFKTWARGVVRDLLKEYGDIYQRAKEEVEALTVKGDRKATAISFQERGTSHLSVMFLLLDGKDPSDIIWKLVKPDAEKDFGSQGIARKREVHAS